MPNVGERDKVFYSSNGHRTPLNRILSLHYPFQIIGNAPWVDASAIEVGTQSPLAFLDSRINGPCMQGARLGRKSMPWCSFQTLLTNRQYIEDRQSQQ